MKIALDFDKTYTEDPDLWDAFIQDARSLGHEVWIVTARDCVNDGINWATIGPRPTKVIWCDGMPKRLEAEAQGHRFDVWIDDDPGGIEGGTAMESEAALKAWREQDKFRNSALEPHGFSKGFYYKGRNRNG